MKQSVCSSPWGSTFAAFSLAALLVTTACASSASSVDIRFSTDSVGEQSTREALQAAIDTAIAQGGPVTLRIEPGTYRLDVPKEEANPFALRIQRANGLTVEAAGAEFIVTTPNAGFLEIRQSRDITLRGGVIDYDPLPFAAGRVGEFAEDRSSFVVEPLPGYPPPDHWQFSAARGWGYFLDPKIPGKLATGMPNVIFDERVEALPDGRYRYHYQAPIPLHHAPLSEGLIFTRIIKTGQLFFAFDSQRLHFENITSYASPSGHYVGNNCEEVTIINCHALIREGRVKGGNADGVHWQNTRGPIIVQDSSFVGISDDGVNLYQKPQYIREVIAPTRLRISADANRSLQRPGSGAFRAGDRIWAFNEHTGTLAGPVDVVAFDPAAGILNLASPLDLPDDPETLAQTGLYGHGFANRVRISGCTFADSRRFGVYLKSHDAVVENNHFHRLSASAIVAMNDTNHAEGLGTHQLLIANNRIEDCGFSLNWESNPHWQAISIFSQMKPFRLATVPGFHRDVRIRNNTVLGTPRGFLLQSIDGLVLEENTFQASSADNPGSVPLDLTGSVLPPK